jgi:hypothetical protein
MVRSLVLQGVLLILIFGQSAPCGQIVGQIDDPQDMDILDFTDITSAWVEKDGSSLTFVMQLRGAVPDPADLPEFNASLTYIWLVDADNNPDTGQSPGYSGSEFNVRAVISQNPGLAGGFVDVVGAMPGGGNGAVVIDGAQVRMTIDRSQIASPSSFHWRSDAWLWVPDSVVSANYLTASGLAIVQAYGVLYQTEPRFHNVQCSYTVSQCAPGSEDPCTATVVMGNSNYNNSGSNPIFLSIDGKYPPEMPDYYQVLTQAMGNAGFMHVRNHARIDVESADPSVFGQSFAQSNFDVEFILYGPDETGPIPPDTFILKYTHDYHLFGIDVKGQTSGRSFAQIVITQVDPLVQKGVWVHQQEALNNDLFAKAEETIDLAAYGFEYGVRYGLDLLLIDEATVPALSPYAEAVTDSTFMGSIEVKPLAGDLNGDGTVNLTDFALFAEDWLASR